MRFVKPQPESKSFNKDVREPGILFLNKNPKPKSWKNKEYWQKSIPDLYEAYGGICCYCAEWIPETVGDPTVDHFISKSTNPQLAYEWNNFRLASLRFNRWKQDFTDVLDPFTLQEGWFTMHFPSLQLKPDELLPPDIQKRVTDTIARLRLNGSICIRSRKRWAMCYRDGKVSFEHLQQNAPFLAHEIERQGLVGRLHEILKN